MTSKALLSSSLPHEAWHWPLVRQKVVPEGHCSASLVRLSSLSSSLEQHSPPESKQIVSPSEHRKGAFSSSTEHAWAHSSLSKQRIVPDGQVTLLSAV